VGSARRAGQGAMLVPKPVRGRVPRPRRLVIARVSRFRTARGRDESCVTPVSPDRPGLHDGSSRNATLSTRSIGPTLVESLDVKNQVDNWTNPFNNRDPMNKIPHCIASCRVTREVPGGRFTAWVGGLRTGPAVVE
jgi:hypothetical protein